MTELVIGEHYVWQNQRVKLRATGVVLRNYYHKGVQIELIQGSTGPQLQSVPTREIASTWEDYKAARERRDREKQIAAEQLQEIKSAMDNLQGAMDDLGLYDPLWMTLVAHPECATMTFENAEQVNKLTDALASLRYFREAEKLLESVSDASLH